MMVESMEKLTKTIYCVIDAIETLRSILFKFFKKPSKFWMKKNKKIVKMRRCPNRRFVKKNCHKRRYREPQTELGGTGCI